MTTSPAIAPAPEPEPRPGVSWRQAVGIPLNVALFVTLMVLAWGDARGFFAHPARTLCVAAFVLMTPVMTCCTAGRSRGVRAARDRPAFFPLLVAHTLFTAWAMPWMDARDVWSLPGGDVLRWSGLVVLVAGVALRVGAMLALKRRFSARVAIQPGHALHTSGFYAEVRHPSYAGVLLMDLGLAGVFRSAIALALLPVVFWMFRQRMAVEETLLEDEFGDAYRAYAARTARLLPGVY